MSNAEHKKMVETITRGLEIAEREMLEEKARNNENVIVCGDDNVIRHIPAKNFLQVIFKFNDYGTDNTKKDSH